VTVASCHKHVFAAAVSAAILGGVPAASQAADLWTYRAPHVRHYTGTTPYYLDWRQRCAYAGYYCLYAEYGYVFHYPFDDRPVAYSHYRRRHR
jgi:hypothetical protein